MNIIDSHRFAVTGDPYFGNVVTLLHFDASFACVIGKTYTAFGSGPAQISSAQSKFGGASGLFNGSNDYLTTPNSTDFDIITLGTAECWVRPTALAGSGCIMGIAPNGFVGWEIVSEADGSIYARGSSAFIQTAASVLAVNTWAHVALNFNAGAAVLYVNGVAGASGTFGTGSPSSQAFHVGLAASANKPFAGYIDELRVTKGVQRYTSNFTPSATAFPDS